MLQNKMFKYLKIYRAHVIIKRCASNSRRRGTTKKYDGTIILPNTSFPLFVKRDVRISTDENIEKVILNH